MSDLYFLERFVEAQQGIFDTALAELKAGRKQSHWMWFIFPQLAELGRSPTAKFYGIASLDEARAFLSHPLLAEHLREVVEAVIPWAERRTAEAIFGPVDAMKFQSSLTLFDLVEPEGPFEEAIEAFYGEPDEQTLALLNRQR